MAGDDHLEEDPETTGIELGNLRLSGSLSLGQRVVGVNGSSSAFREHDNVDTGFLLREGSLRGERIDGRGGLDSFEVEAIGLGDTATSVRAGVEAGPWSATSRYQRSQYVGTSDSDLHPFDVDREQARLGVERRWDRGRAGIEVVYQERNGLTLGTRRVGFGFVEGFPRHTDETRLSTTGNLSWDLGWGRLTWRSTAERLEAEDRLVYAAAPSNFPTETVTEDFDADTDGWSVGNSARLEGELLDGRLDLDGGFSWHYGELDGRLSDLETGFLFDPSLPFSQDARSDLDVLDREWSIDAGGTYRWGPKTDLYLRFEHQSEVSDGRLDRVVTLDEMMGDPPSVSSFQSTSEWTGHLERVEAGGVRTVAEGLDLDLSLSWGSEDLDVREVVDGVETRVFRDRVEEYGAEATVSIDSDPSWHADVYAGYDQRPTETARTGTFFTFDDDRAVHVGFELRWKPTSRWTWSANARHDQSYSKAFDSKRRRDRGAVAAALRPVPSVEASLAFSYSTFDLESDTTFVFFDPLMGIQNVPVEVSFEGIQRSLSGSLRWDAADRFRPSLALTSVVASGNSAFRYRFLRLELPYDLSKAWRLGAETTLVDFDASGTLAASEHEAVIAAMYLTFSF